MKVYHILICLSFVPLRSYVQYICFINAPNNNDLFINSEHFFISATVPLIRRFIARPHIFMANNFAVRAHSHKSFLKPILMSIGIN